MAGQIADMLPVERLRPGGYRGTVVKAPEASDDGILVLIEAFDAPRSFGPAPWVAHLNAVPERGDECLVVVDDEGEPWVMVWGSSGDLETVVHTVHSVDGPPPLALGSDGDLAIDEGTLDVYRRVAGAWGDPVSRIGSKSVYIQEDAPVAVAPYLWIELNPDGSLKTFWVAT